MSNQPNAAAPSASPVEMEKVIALGLAAMKIVEGASDAIALDALLNAYVNTARVRGKVAMCAQVMVRVAQQLGAVATLPAAAAREPAAPAPGYTPEDVVAIKALIDRISDTLDGQYSRIGLSALLTVYMDVAQASGQTIPAARFLLVTGGRALAEQHAGADANVPPPPGLTLH